MRKNLQLNPQGDGLAFLAMISWGCYSALIKKIGEWEYGRYKKSVFLWYSIFDPSADPAESQLETGDTDEAGSPRQFPVSGAS